MNPYYKELITLYPEFESSEVEIVDHGQNNMILIIDEKWIFRFPKTEVNRHALEVEVDCLSILNEKVSFRIPEFKYHHFGERLETCFVGYEIIPGEMLLKDTFMKKDPKIIGLQLSDILFELHQPYMRTLFENRVKVEDPYLEMMGMYRRIKSKLYTFMRPEKQEETTMIFEEILHALKGLDFESTLVHGDFGPTNILVSETDSTITGIIDFGELHIGDPAVDVSSLIGTFGYGEAFVLKTFVNYPGVDKMIYRAKLYAKTFALQEALYGIENDDKRAFDAGIATYI